MIQTCESLIDIILPKRRINSHVTLSKFSFEPADGISGIATFFLHRIQLINNWNKMQKDIKINQQKIMIISSNKPNPGRRPSQRTIPVWIIFHWEEEIGA